MNLELGQQQQHLHYSPNRNGMTHSVPLGGSDDIIIEEETGPVTWEEICRACCHHSFGEWMWIGAAIFGILHFFYFFLLGLYLMQSSARVMSGCSVGHLFGEDTNPITGLMTGMLSTVLLQSASATCSIIVSLAGEEISLQQGIFMVMGANIGSTVTNTLVALGHYGDDLQYERAFAGATLHDMFNLMSVAVLFPLEVMTGYLNALSGAIVENSDVKDGKKWRSPIKKIVSPVGKRIIISNRRVPKYVAGGHKDCQDFYPNQCKDGTPTYKSCGGHFGLIACSKRDDFCPLFFSKDATLKDDRVSGGVVFLLSLLLLFASLIGIVTILQKLFVGMSSRVVYAVTKANGYFAMILGAGLTMLVQSSSITTSILTPLVAMGLIRLDQMYPLTLGANLGTAFTTIMAAMVSDLWDALHVALAHLFFNVTGIVIFYPLPMLRRLPLVAAQRLGRATRLWPLFPLLYVLGIFILFPMVALFISYCMEQTAKGWKVMGSFLILGVVSVLIYGTYWRLFLGGRRLQDVPLDPFFNPPQPNHNHGGDNGHHHHHHPVATTEEQVDSMEYPPPNGATLGTRMHHPHNNGVHG